LVLAIAPWGEVFIDGKSVGISPPLNELKLAPGPHYLEVRNGGFAPVLKRIEVQANETLKIRHRFADAR
jgi:serine/threonine-protein kinase